MPAPQDNISYEQVCTLVGRLYIESERLYKAIDELRTQNESLRKENDRLKRQPAEVPGGPGQA